jgi:pre-mRNA-splicing factor RBM22/SLT11
MATKFGSSKEGWERSDFPIVCETCLGDNPYVRMTRAEFDKECKICSRPFTVFRWRPGSNARFKKTEICQTCAKLKNVCQTCLLDLEFGLPVQVRDTALPQSQLIPQSDANREWFAEQAERELASSQINYGKAETRYQLQKVARSSPYYKRNEAHICSFFIKGECKRGAECPYKHELPLEDPDLSHQNIKDRYFGVNDPVAKKILSKMNLQQLTPPEDKEIKTLWIGNITSEITEKDIQDIFYPFGKIIEIKIIQKNMCAFITYSNREEAENAAQQLYNNLTIKGINLKLSWAKPTEQTQQDNSFFTMPTNYYSYSGNPTYVYPTYAPLQPGIKPIYPSMNPQRLGSKTDR